jgi:tetratricopeptide (TPR) repeat protein
MKIRLLQAWPLLIALLLLSGDIVFAQQASVSEARLYSAQNNYDKALPLYKELYSTSPDSVYYEYFNALIAAKKYKVAEELVAKQMSRERQNPFLYIDLGVAYSGEGKEAKAKEQFNEVLRMVNGDDMLTQRIVNAFTDRSREDYAILTYEKALQMLGSTFLVIYAAPLARLYAKTGAIDKAIETLLAGNPGQNIGIDNVKAILLELLGNDPEKLRTAQKSLMKKINAQPESAYYAELLTWIYTQKNDWEGALIQIEAIDERNREDGMRLINLARTAVSAKQYETAYKAYDDVIAKGSSSQFYIMAKTEKLNTALTQLKNNPAYKPGDVTALEKMYDSFLVEFPISYSTYTASDYAVLEAQYAHNVPKAIAILNKAISSPDTRRDMAARFKLLMGDYYALEGKIWDASLTYSQVDKDFKQDAMGEDARFRNAKLAYYRGDFEWAQRQLSILKSATSELISNDAIYLSVLITENVQDSDKVPLQRFAYAGLLTFQNRDKEAETLLDSLNKAFPKHALNDDILMARAGIAQKHNDYNKALGYLETICKQYGDDVLGDDAVFKIAEIYRVNLNQNDKAKHYYEQLIIDYPGSTYVQAARLRLAELNNGVNP